MTDDIVTVRDEDLRGYHVVVTAERCERLGSWLVICRVDGALFDSCDSDFPEQSANEMIKEIDEEYE